MKKLFTILIFVGLFGSCSIKDENSPSSTSNFQNDYVKNLINFENAENQTFIGGIQIRGEMTQINTSRSKTSLKRDDRSKRKNSKLFIDGKEWNSSNQGTIRLEPGKSQTILEFGKVVNIKTIMNINNKQVEEEGELYIPEPIEITNYDEMQSTLSTGSNDELTIRWDPDPLNSNPIVVYLIARDFNLEEVSDSYYSPYIYTFFNDLEDSGSTTIKSSTMSQFPAGIEIDVILARGTATVLRNEIFGFGTSDLVTLEVSEGIKSE